MIKHKYHIIIGDDEPIDIALNNIFSPVEEDDDEIKVQKTKKNNAANKLNEIAQHKRLLYDIYSRRIFELNDEEVNRFFSLFKAQYAVIDNLLDRSSDSEYINSSMKNFMAKLFRNPGMHPNLVVKEINKIRGHYCPICNDYRKLVNCTCKLVT